MENPPYLNDAHFIDGQDSFQLITTHRKAGFFYLKRRDVERAYPKWFSFYWNLLALENLGTDTFSMDEKAAIAQDLAIWWLVFFDRNEKSLWWFPLLRIWSRIDTKSFDVVRRHVEQKWGSGSARSEQVATSILKIPVPKYRMQAKIADDYAAMW